MIGNLTDKVTPFKANLFKINLKLIFNNNSLALWLRYVLILINIMPNKLLKLQNLFYTTNCYW